MSYNTLPESLFQTADLAKAHFANEFGLTRIKVETEIHREINYRPTFFAQLKHHLVCIDVVESNIFTVYRKAFIQECEKMCLPVKFYVVLPEELSNNSTVRELADAKRYGVGVVLLNTPNNTVQWMSQALSLSLTTLRAFDKSTFPKKYRDSIKNAEEVFKSGEPNKACSIVYDEIESLSRKLAIKLQTLNLLNQVRNINDYKTMQWATMLDFLQNNIKRNDPKCVLLTKPLISKLHGITAYRNESGHKPGSQKKLIERDRQLRTRLESAMDIFLELIQASKVFRI